MSQSPTDAGILLGFRNGEKLSFFIGGGSSEYNIEPNDPERDATVTDFSAWVQQYNNIIFQDTSS